MLFVLCCAITVEYRTVNVKFENLKGIIEN